MHEARTRVEAETEEPDLPHHSLEGHRVVVRNVEGNAVELLRGVAPRPTGPLSSGLR